jgi:tetratricopeptide (TPR) repeat protein
MPRHVRDGSVAPLLRGLLGAACIGVTSAQADVFDRPWCELRTPDFRLVTDQPRHQAETAIRRLLRFRTVAEPYLPGEPNAGNPPLTIVLFTRARDFRQVTRGNPWISGFMQPSLADNLLVVGPPRLTGAFQDTLLHEYTHYLLRTRRELHLPPWFDEGMASLLGAVDLDGESVVIGKLPLDDLAADLVHDADHRDPTRPARRVALKRVIETDDLAQWRGRERRIFYSWSWALAHRLVLGQEDTLTDLRDPLAAYIGGQTASLTHALDTAPAALERELQRYLERRPPTITLSVPPVDAAPTSYRCLDARDTALTISATMLHLNPADAMTHLRAFVERSSDDPTLWVALSQAQEAAQHTDAALITARRAHELDDGVDGSIRLASALSAGCILIASAECRERWREAVPLLRSALSRDPTRHDAVFVLGLAYLYSGRAGEALNYLRIAHGRQPWASHVNFYLGEAYRLVGDTRSREHLERARAWSNTELWRLLADAALAELET